jgi:hypothetical protein
MAEWTIIMKVALGPNHLCPGRTRHAISDGKGHREFPPFVRLEIAKYPGDQDYYLLHICADGSIADTCHGTLEEALHQAEWELGVQLNEWQMAQH